MKRRTRTPKIHPLSRATAAVLIGLIIAPALPAKNPFAFDHTGQQEETEFHSATADSVVSQGANAALDEVVSFVGDSNLPFLGSLQGGVTYDHANGLLRYNLSTVGKLYGNGTGHHWLGQIGVHNEADRDTVNAGLIYRWIDVNKAWLIGTNLFYDRDFDTGAQRAGFGVEAATQQWRVFSNVYRGISNKWRDALGDGDKWEERVANGYDLGAAWSPAALPSLDLQLKASRWLGDDVDVFDNDSPARRSAGVVGEGRLHADPAALARLRAGTHGQRRYQQPRRPAVHLSLRPVAGRTAGAVERRAPQRHRRPRARAGRTPAPHRDGKAREARARSRLRRRSRTSA